jgi:2-polyprenyl-3-methyl-5-hydroxy-6-metoxy-1,4-benzoquinol methylase
MDIAAPLTLLCDMTVSGERPTFPVFLAKQLIMAGQRTRFRGVGGYSPEAFIAKGHAAPFPQATRESLLYPEFFAFFRESELQTQIRGREVLDFGCGYGGRTVDYARLGGARFVWGVEPVQTPIELARQYAKSLNVGNVEFRICGQREIPLPDQSVDVVVSYDVLEHVLSPPDSVEEMFRVLRPGGLAFLVFPVYLGMRSHHLDYVTALPGLHWLFSAETLVRSVNAVLLEDEDMRRFGTRPQPYPALSFDGRRRVLPMLNGLSGRHLTQLFAKFADVQIRRHVVLRSKRGFRVITEWLSGRGSPNWLRDAVTDSVSCVLRKPAN